LRTAIAEVFRLANRRAEAWASAHEALTELLTKYIPGTERPEAPCVQKDPTR
jgi:hypothetical protein